MEREVVVALANSPGVVDFYVWLAWKSWVLKTGKALIPLFAPGGLRDQLGCRMHPEDRFLRRKINQWLRVIRAHWPQCPAGISADGQSLIISSSKSSPALHPVQMNLTTIVRSLIRQCSLRLLASAVWQIQLATDTRLALSSRYLTHGDFSPVMQDAPYGVQ